MIFVEAPAFCRWREENLDDEGFRALQNVLIVNPRAGEVIPNSGGLRKVRVALPGRGKRGGARTIYFWWADEDRVYFLLGYAKNVKDDLLTHQRTRLSAAMKAEMDNG